MPPGTVAILAAPVMGPRLARSQGAFPTMSCGSALGPTWGPTRADSFGAYFIIGGLVRGFEASCEWGMNPSGGSSGSTDLIVRILTAAHDSVTTSQWASGLG
jgi:hypothetical protein